MPRHKILDKSLEFLYRRFYAAFFEVEIEIILRYLYNIANIKKSGGKYGGSEN